MPKLLRTKEFFRFFVSKLLSKVKFKIVSPEFQTVTEITVRLPIWADEAISIFQQILKNEHVDAEEGFT